MPMSCNLEDVASGLLVVPGEEMPPFQLSPDGTTSRCLRVFNTSSTTKATSSLLIMLLIWASSPSLLPEHCGQLWPLLDLVTRALATFGTFAVREPSQLGNLHSEETFDFTMLRHSRKDDFDEYQQRGNVTFSVLIGYCLLDSFSVTLQRGARIKHTTSRDRFIVT